MSADREFLIAHIGHTNKHHEHVTWWKADSRGYTICVEKAGRYGADEAASICHTGENIAVCVLDVTLLARTTPYYRLSNGTLGKLYDGGPHQPVPNSRGCWDALLQMRAYPPPQTTTAKPTPIGVKARAIYVDAFPRRSEGTSGMRLTQAAADHPPEALGLDQQKQAGTPS